MTTPTFLVVSTYSVSIFRSRPDTGPELRARSARSCFSLEICEVSLRGDIWPSLDEISIPGGSAHGQHWNLVYHLCSPPPLPLLLHISRSLSPPARHSHLNLLSSQLQHQVRVRRCCSPSCCCLAATSFFTWKCKRIFEIIQH